VKALFLKMGVISCVALKTSRHETASNINLLIYFEIKLSNHSPVLTTENTQSTTG